MTITAQDVIQRAVGILQDTTSIRWPVNELIRWFNDAQNIILIARPDALNTTNTMTLSAGTRQRLDSATGNAAGNAVMTPTPAKLIEITRNVATTSAKGAVTMVERRCLDEQSAGWHALPGTVNVLHYMSDARDPKTFYVFPPALVTAQLEVMYSAFPTAIAPVADGALYTAVIGSSNLPDTFMPVLLDLILYRAYSKNSEYAGNEQRAANHFNAAKAMLGDDIAATLANAPQVQPVKKP